jgi:DNA mismatch repair protein MutS
VRFHSILFDQPENSVDVDEREEPSFIADLNLDQVLESMTAGRGEYNLKPFFYAPLRDVEAVHYRHEIIRDLEKKTVFESVGNFARKMREMRKHLAQAQKLHYKYQKERWFLDAVEIYCDAVSALTDELTRLDVQSRGFLAFREYLTNYTRSDGFTALAAETQQLQDALSDVRYCVHIKGNRVTVSKYEEEVD